MTNKVTEHGEAIALFDYVMRASGKYPELNLFHAIPNGARMSWTRDNNGRRYSSAARSMLAEGLRRGVPDYYLPVPRSGYHGLYLELKANDYMPSEDQVLFLIRTRQLSYRSTCVWSTDAAIEILNNYLTGRDLINNRIFYNVPDNKREALEILLDLVINNNLPELDYTKAIIAKNVTLID